VHVENSIHRIVFLTIKNVCFKIVTKLFVLWGFNNDKRLRPPCRMGERANLRRTELLLIIDGDK
jgi:hypothetical protein